jgi:hypothetical protein
MQQEQCIAFAVRHCGAANTAPCIMNTQIRNVDMLRILLPIIKFTI